MKVTPRAHILGIALYSLPFLAIIGTSLFFVSAGNAEIIVAGVALLPAVLYFFGLRWCRYVVGTFSAMGFLACSMIPIMRGTDGRYFWLIWSPIWLLFAFSTFISFIPVRQTPHDVASSSAD
jgi:hypothetical protein